MDVIIKRNTPIPTRKESTYVTTKDNQTTITVDVFQGERTVAKENNWLGVFQVAVPPAPKGKSEIKVVFNIDANGILDCSGEEVTTGLKKKIRISSDKQRLSKAEIDTMLKDAQKYKLQDEEYNKKVFARNALEDYVYNVKNKVKKVRTTSKGKLHIDDIKKIENAAENASKCLDGSKLADADLYEKTLNQLEKLCVPIIAKLVQTPLLWWRRSWSFIVLLKFLLVFVFFRITGDFCSSFCIEIFV